MLYMKALTEWKALLVHGFMYDTKPKAQFKISGTFKENRS